MFKLFGRFAYLFIAFLMFLSFQVNVDAKVSIKERSVFMKADGVYFYPERSITRAEAALAMYSLSVDKTLRGIPKSFNDVTQNHDAYVAVRYCSSLGLMNGYPDSTFRPNNPLTRAEMSVILCKFSGLSAEKVTAQSFTDVALDHWASPFINAVKVAGSMKGYEDGSFRPGRFTTRAEFVTMFSFSRQLITLSACDFSDVPREHWAYKYIVSASEAAPEQELLKLTNAERIKVGISPLTLDSALCSAARFKSNDMATHGYFYHDSPTYGKAESVLGIFGISHKSFGENIAKGQKNVEEVMAAWLSSPDHKATILNPRYNKIGLGCARNSNGVVYWAQEFVEQ